MTSGVAFTPQETEAKKAAIVESIANGVDITFTGCCKHHGIGISTAYEWREKDPEWKTAVDAARKRSRETGLDFAEHILIKKIQQEETNCVFYYLDRHGKERGYVKQQKTILEGGDKPVGVSGEFTLTFGTEDNDGSDDEFPAGDEGTAATGGQGAEVEAPAALPKTT